jgi:hypothetical protein
MRAGKTKRRVEAELQLLCHRNFNSPSTLHCNVRLIAGIASGFGGRIQSGSGEGSAGGGEQEVDSDSVRHQLVQSILDTLSEFLATRDDFNAKIIESIAVNFHRGVFEMAGTPHLRSQVRTTSFDSFEFGVELPVHLDLAPGSARETQAKHLEPTRQFLQAAGKQKRCGKSRKFERTDAVQQTPWCKAHVEAGSGADIVGRWQRNPEHGSDVQGPYLHTRSPTTMTRRALAGLRPFLEIRVSGKLWAWLKGRVSTAMSAPALRRRFATGD